MAKTPITVRIRTSCGSRRSVRDFDWVALRGDDLDRVANSMYLNKIGGSCYANRCPSDYDNTIAI